METQAEPSSAQVLTPLRRLFPLSSYWKGGTGSLGQDRAEQEPQRHRCLGGHDAIAECFELSVPRQARNVGDPALPKALHPLHEARGEPQIPVAARLYRRRN